MKKFKNIIIMAAFILPILFLATSCGDDDDDSDKAGWTDENKASNVASCVAIEQGNQEQCECFYNKLAKSYTYDEFQDLAEQDDPPADDFAKIVGFADDCDIDIFE